MLYISSKNEYPRYYGDLKLEHPEWEIGNNLPHGWNEVSESPVPEISDSQIVEELFPEIIDDKFVQVWTIRDMTEEEIAERNAPITALAKLNAAGLTDYERQLIALGIVR